MTPNVNLCIVSSIRIAYCFVRIAIRIVSVVFCIDPALNLTLVTKLTFDPQAQVLMLTSIVYMLTSIVYMLTSHTIYSIIMVLALLTLEKHGAQTFGYRHLDKCKYTCPTLQGSVGGWGIKSE